MTRKKTTFKVDGYEVELPFTLPEIEWSYVAPAALVLGVFGFIYLALSSGYAEQKRIERCELTCTIDHERNERPWESCRAKCLIETEEP